MNEIFVVLGMHKSGTTMVSEMLEHSGIPMIDHKGEGRYADGNFFERESTKQINKTILGCGDASSLTVIDRPDPAKLTPDDFDKARKVISEICEKNPSWGFKDPRTCMTYEFWKQVLPPHRLICIYRRDHEVHGHYAKKRKGQKLRGAYALRAWNRYNRAMLDHFSNAPETAVLIDYSKLITCDKELARLEQFVGKKLKDTRSPEMRRHSEPNSKFNRDRFFARFLLRSDASATQKELDQQRDQQASIFENGKKTLLPDV